MLLNAISSPIRRSIVRIAPVFGDGVVTFIAKLPVSLPGSRPFRKPILSYLIPYCNWSSNDTFTIVGLRKIELIDLV